MFSTSLFSYAAIAATFAAQVAALPTQRAADPPATNDMIHVKSLGTLSLSSPGFAAVIPQEGKNTLFVSSFSAFGSDSVYRIDNIANAATSSLSSLTTTQVPGDITWPNDVTPAPKSIFGTDGILVGGGFLVPGKSNGGIYFSSSVNGQSSPWVELASKSGWFYHRAVFADMDGDGVLDLVSCRAHKPLIGGTSTMLVWLKPADAKKPAGPWVETEIGPGCDALFAVADINNDGIPEVLAASYFTSSFNMFTSSAKTGYTKKSDVYTITLDLTVGAAFDVQVTDVNNDGKVDLLVTNHQGDGTGSVFAYEIPADITNPKNFVRHTLASGFPVTQGGFNQASPGSPAAFFPTPESKKGPAYIALAGDAAQIAYVLVPGSGAWSYTPTVLHNCGCTVGKVEVADVDGDGYQEVFIPCYDNGVLAAYSFKA